MGKINMIFIQLNHSNHINFNKIIKFKQMKYRMMGILVIINKVSPSFGMLIREKKVFFFYFFEKRDFFNTIF